MTREAKLAALLESARAVRKRPPGFVWILALLVGGACIGGFVMIVLADPAAPAAPLATVPAAPAGGGFVSGVIIGVVVGIIVGMGLQATRAAKAAARYARYATELEAADHSDASKP